MTPARHRAARPARAAALPWLLLATLLTALAAALALLAGPAVAAPAPAPPASAGTPEQRPAGAAPEAHEEEPEPLRIGMRGQAVRDLQRELRRHGVRLRPDGVFGRVTRAAVKRVQRKLGMTATGVAGPDLLERLGLVPPLAEEAAGETALGDGAAAESGEPGRSEVVAFARRLLGTPYRYGGDDPTGFDCSGFVAFVYDRFGVSMPRSAAEQHAAFPEVAREDLRPGDLVFFNGLGHDGIYIGKGRFIHSSKPGDVVKISRLGVSWYAARYEGAVRPR